MGIIRWVLSHLVLILVIVAVGFGFVYRKPLATEFGYERELAQLETDLDWRKLWPEKDGPLVRVTAIEGANSTTESSPVASEQPAMKVKKPESRRKMTMKT